MEGSEQRVICFDFWNTLGRSVVGGGASYREVLVRIGAKPDEIYPIVRDELMVGSFDYQLMVRHLCSRLGLTASAADIDEAAANWRRDNDRSEWLPGARELLKELRQRPNVMLVLITNITEPAWGSIRDRLGAEQLFNYLFLSCREGISKPDPKVWERIQATFPRAREFWMVGDNQKDDLDIPARIGWRTVLVGDKGVPISEVSDLLP